MSLFSRYANYTVRERERVEQLLKPVLLLYTRDFKTGLKFKFTKMSQTNFRDFTVVNLNILVYMLIKVLTRIAVDI